MHAVVNQLHFREPVDPALFVRAQSDLAPQERAIDGFKGFHLVQTSETEAILVIFGDDADTLDRIATEVGSPWMRANVVPQPASPPERHLGQVVASAE
jgi:hypothetical protein